MYTVETEKVPIKIWASSIEDTALEQAKNVANLDITYHHVAVMADAHQGFGVPIGGVFAAKDAVVPNAVGVDIGCGMCAVRTNIQESDSKAIKKFLGSIREEIPVGFNHRKQPVPWEEFKHPPEIHVIQQEIESAKHQLGTLGGGNHFIEVQQDQEQRIWLMVHSGSRNFGFKIAKHFHSVAKNWCKAENISLPTTELAYLPFDHPQAEKYIEAMNFALAFAFENRMQMMKILKQEFSSAFKKTEYDEVINIHHNYAAKEHHFGEDVVVHRKGATSAQKEQTGIIPGSQGTHSFIVKGKGNPESFCSCSHGAGRKMGRKEAQRKLDLSKEQGFMENQGIIHSIRSKKDLDEAAGAYKNIQTVMKDQNDLVEILTELKPLAVIKG
ncbi:MAG: RtcB family protein [Spirochaetia bacterium]